MTQNNAASPALLTVDALSVSFTKAGQSPIEAVRNVSFTVGRGECVVILGESGSGKSVTAQALLGLHDAERTTVVADRLDFDGQPLLGADSALSGIRGQRMSMIFQDALSALNPVQRVGTQIAEMFQVHRRMRRREANERAIALMEAVQIPDAARRARSYPHELSGGMRQRIVIAMALALDPELLIADEPTTALDVTVQSQILVLLRALREEKGMSLLLITHDVGVAAEMADRIVVMYAASIVETGTAEEILLNPRHPYTIGLLQSVPRADLDTLPQPISGGLPDPSALPPGCVFAPRCPAVMARCHTEVPLLRRDASGRESACHLLESSELATGAHHG